MGTPPGHQHPAAQQTADQANAVAWLSNVVLQQNTIAADDAGLEYSKWAGSGAGAYESMLTSNPSEATLQNFLSADPLNYVSGESSQPRVDLQRGLLPVEPPPAPIRLSTAPTSIRTRERTRTVTPPVLTYCPTARRTSPPKASSWPGAPPTPTKSPSITALFRRSPMTSPRRSGFGAAAKALADGRRPGLEPHAGERLDGYDVGSHPLPVWRYCCQRCARR